MFIGHIFLYAIKYSLLYYFSVNLTKQNVVRAIFQTFGHAKYGLCHTFNHGFNQSVLQTSHIGAEYGFKLLLYINQVYQSLLNIKQQAFSPPANLTTGHFVLRTVVF